MGGFRSLRTGGHSLFARSRKEYPAGASRQGIEVPSPQVHSPDRQGRELLFWKRFYNAIVHEPTMADVFGKLGLGSVEDRKEFSLTPDQWKRLDARGRILEVGRSMTFPRYQKELGIGKGSLKGKAVLDVGCGPMGALKWFHSRSRFGLDELVAEYRAIGYPLEAHETSYVQGKAENMPFPDEKFDAVLSVNALDRVEDFSAALSEIFRVLKPGGRFYLSFICREKPEPGLLPLTDTSRQGGPLPAFRLFQIQERAFPARGRDGLLPRVPPLTRSGRGGFYASLR
ncbi:MAG: class I SAM-dependent methyltransferase [Thermodesulfovibrionales bacterium]